MAGDEERVGARGKWFPALGHVFGVRPFEMGSLRYSEYAAMVDYINRLNGER